MGREKMDNLISVIENSLPNGFHDSRIFKHHVDEKKQEAEIILGVDISDVDSNDGSIIFKRGKLILTGLVFFIKEPPRSSDKRNFLCDAGVLEGEKLSKVYPAGLPEDTFGYWFFLNETNSFIYVAAKSASFEWLD
jgi:hypothetical protein